MNARRVIGFIFLYIGIIATLFALIATLLPILENEQIRLIVASFDEPTSNAVLWAVNQFFLWMMHNPSVLFGIGGGLGVLGAFLLWNGNRQALPPASRPTPPPKLRNPPRDSAPRASAPAPDWRRSAPAPLPPSQLDSWLGEAAPRKDFSPMVVRQEPIKSPTLANASSTESNPYLSYGQSAYAPPKRETSPKPAPPEPNSPYQKPIQETPLEEKPPDVAAIKPQEGPASSLSEAAALSSATLSSAVPKPMVFRKAPLTENEKKEDVAATFLSSPRIRSTMSSKAPMTAPASEEITPPVLEQTAAPSPQYLSKRIRSTMKKRATS